MPMVKVNHAGWILRCKKKKIKTKSLSLADPLIYLLTYFSGVVSSVERHAPHLHHSSSSHLGTSCVTHAGASSVRDKFIKNDHTVENIMHQSIRVFSTV